MENEQFSAVFEWVFFFLVSVETANKSSNVIDGLRGMGSVYYYEGSLRSFQSQKKRFQLNWFWMRRCLLPVYCPIEKCVRVRRGEGKGTGQAKQGDYNSIKLPSGPASHWLTFALTFALLVIARAARCRPLPVWGLSPGKRVAQPPFNPSPCYHPLDWGLSAVFVMPQ